MGLMLTTRDLHVIDFLEEYRIASTTTLTAMFFPSLSAAQKRLKTLSDNNRIKRARLTMNHDYVYYIKKPGNFMHDLLRTDFYRELSRRCKVLKFVPEKTLGKIRPDALFAYEINGNTRLGLLEVEISNKGLDTEKYENFYYSGIYKSYFPIMPTIYVVTKKSKPPINSDIKYIFIKPDMSNFSLNN